GLFAVLLLVFSRAAGLSQGVEHYPIYLLTAVVLWTFFAETTSGGVMSLTSAADLLRRMRLPSLALPLAVVLKAGFNLVLNLLAVAVFVVAYGVEPRLGWLELPLLAGFLALFGGGLALVLGALYVRFRDVHQAWSVALQFLFFASPIVFVSSRYPEGLQQVLDLSPLAVVFTQMRHALIDPSAPSAAEAAGGAHMLVVPVAIVAAVLAAGIWLFRREAPRIAERL
ncbi:MAG TPA: ABC transporter permease, partial [Solirubrobacteraceae bacterium]